MTRRCAASCLGLAVLLAGCAAPPSAPPTEAPRPAPPSRETTVEQQHRARALTAMQERRWADALVQWELLLLLRPSSAEYRGQLEATRKHIDETSADALKAGAEARKRGDLDSATTQFLRAIAADRDNDTAAQALREIERERMRRSFLNRAPRGMPTPNGAATAGELAEVDQAAMLYRQGNYAAASQVLQRYLQRNPTDAVARGYLADSYYLLALAATRENRKEDALALLEKSQAAGPSDPNAVANAARELRRSLASDYSRRAAELHSREPRKAVEMWEQVLRLDPGDKEATLKLREARLRAGATPQ